MEEDNMEEKEELEEAKKKDEEEEKDGEEEAQKKEDKEHTHRAQQATRATRCYATHSHPFRNHDRAHFPQRHSLGGATGKDCFGVAMAPQTSSIFIIFSFVFVFARLSRSASQTCIM